ncbi:MAG TPA: GGDEF domain-containing protein [Hyphomicrobiaceae bacterium]
MARATRQRRQVVLLFLDLNGFKAINDSLGHVEADRLLQQVGGRLTSCIRRSDTACRFGGDEFVVLLTGIERRNQAMAVINTVIVELAAPYQIDGIPVSMTASLGVATFPADGQNYHELLQAADATMYRDKASCCTVSALGPEAV